ncbi:BglII/BstYI family type II restriction endonuclease [Hydrogenivirga sp.]
MIIAAEYSFNSGKEIISQEVPDLEKEIKEIIMSIKAEKCKKKISKERTMKGRLLYYPPCLNKSFKEEFLRRGWEQCRIPCEYSDKYYTTEFRKIVSDTKPAERPYREMDFVKVSEHGKKVGVEVQFGKYSFMVYNVAAKMTIFKNLEVIDYGVEIVPVKKLADNMSSGVSYFEQFVWDLEHRGISNIDIPVWIIGVYPEASAFA